jgi:hypothetical protein
LEKSKNIFEPTQEFVQRSVPRDGHCLFSSFCIVLRELPELEDINVTYLRKNVADFNRHSTYIDDEVLMSETGNNRETYCNEIANTNTWGGEAEIRAVAALYHITIRVVHVMKQDDIISAVYVTEFSQIDQSLEKAVYIIYNGNHYEPLCLHDRNVLNKEIKIFNRNDIIMEKLISKFIKDLLKCIK